MKMKFHVLLTGLVILLAVNTEGQTNIAGSRKTIEFDFDWRFHQGDEEAAKDNGYDDSHWRLLDLPHDWSIEGPFDLNNPSGWSGAYLPGGTGWYRKHFTWKKQAGQHAFIQFDGIYMNSEVWINGHYLGRRPYGYTSFQYELSPYLRDGENVIAVKADNSKLPSGRWYTGSGIYRHVHLTVTNSIYIPQWGTYISTPVVNSEKAEISIQVEMENSTGKTNNAVLQTTIFSPAGKIIDQQSQPVKLDTGHHQLSYTVKVLKPSLWSPEHPAMYKIVHRIMNGKKQEDEYSTFFGIRSIHVDAVNGFVLNGKKIKLNGVSNHHDAGPVGAAVPDDVLYRRLKLLKDMGCNAIRTAHNPAAPEFYTMCDTLGLLVLDEAFDGWDQPKAAFDYGLYFNEWWQKDLEDFIKRDRNHPCVVMWSIGNEVPDFKAERQKELVTFLKALDHTRPVTQARGSVMPYVDVAGFNGDGEIPGVLEKYHKENPNMPVLGTEITHTLQTRGVYASKTWYRTRDYPAPWEKNVKWEKFQKNVFMIPDLSDTEVFKNTSAFYQSSYDNAIVRIGVRDQHKRTDSMPYMIGTFRWTGFDYLGEATIQPARTANFGIIDLCGFPKDHYYLYQSLWSAKPMVHLLPHWTHPGMEGVIIPVVAYTNAETVELFLNGKSLGEKRMTDDLQIVWQVPYKAGTLKAVARSKHKIVAIESIATATDAFAVKSIADKKTVHANKRDVIHVEINITDKKGITVPYARNLVQFKIEGPGKIIGVENGDITDFSSMKAGERKAFSGKCLLLVQTTGEPGTISITSSAEGLATDKTTIVSAPLH